MARQIREYLFLMIMVKGSVLHTLTTMFRGTVV